MFLLMQRLTYMVRYTIIKIARLSVISLLKIIIKIIFCCNKQYQNMIQFNVIYALRFYGTL